MTPQRTLRGRVGGKHPNSSAAPLPSKTFLFQKVLLRRLRVGGLEGFRAPGLNKPQGLNILELGIESSMVFTMFCPAWMIDASGRYSEVA